MTTESKFVRELRERGLYEAARKICRRGAIRLEELVDKTNFAPIVLARRRFAFHLKNKVGWSPSMIARLLHRDHSTIFSLLRDSPKPRAKR
jgi:hypothetical protein